ncbi:YihY/virulence factor BrkB family protein, partial [Streptomyces sp. NPDC059455]
PGGRPAYPAAGTAQPSGPPPGGRGAGAPRPPRLGPRRPEVRSAADGADDTAADDDHPVR